jgi:DNA excision repair protein ERCC-3
LENARVPAICIEVRVPLEAAFRPRYTSGDPRLRFRIASENPAKVALTAALVARHRGGHVLVIGQFLDQLAALKRSLGAPLITGKTPNAEREVLYAQFRRGELPVLIVSKVGNFAIDLPEANVAIQVSGTFGSRQEEAQRLGRILRPKNDGSTAVFYSLVTEATRDQDFAEKRQRFLTEQGYGYQIVDAASVLADFPGTQVQEVS